MLPLRLDSGLLSEEELVRTQFLASWALSEMCVPRRVVFGLSNLSAFFESPTRASNKQRFEMRYQALV